MNGTLYGLGIGPGDPELITVKARRILAEAPVIAYPAPEGGNSLVREIAAPHVPGGRIEIAIATPMAVERFPAQAVYDHYAAEIAGHLSDGRDVAVLCEGDPFLYGSYMYLHERLAPRFPSLVVPGVSSLTAVAAVAGRPLASRNEVLAVIPAPLNEHDLEARLRASDAAAILKVGRHLGKVRRVLRRLGLEDRSVYVERATMPSGRVIPLAEIDDDGAPYFSMILVNSADRPQLVEPMPAAAAVVALTAVGTATARRIAAVLPGATVHGLAGRIEDADETFTGTAAHLRRLFADGTPIIGVCAAGILIRALAPLLTDKQTEPPVVAVGEDGAAVVPLLGGHHGANALARHLAHALGGYPAVTTAGDIRFGVSLDAPPRGWHIADGSRAKDTLAGLLSGGSLSVQSDIADPPWPPSPWRNTNGHGTARLLITHRSVHRPEAMLVVHPPVLAVGLGCERGTSANELIGLVQSVLDAAGLAGGAVACVASVDVKADERAIHEAAAFLGCPARFFAPATLERETPRLPNPSPRVFHEVGCHGVAEAAALAAAGPDADLLVAKTKSLRATCAIALSPRPIDAEAVGYPQGRLSLVGIGPGRGDWRSPEATRLLAEATDIVGYALYLDLIAHLTDGKTVHAGAMTREEERCRLALDLAAAGRAVALVSSGDAGIYGMAPLVFELLDRENRPAWNRIAVTIAPGLSAVQAAAARIGAPLGHDFCAVSLSDLLTPWEVIERRLRAAAAGDFVVALYNPVSRKRRSQLSAARDILLQSRSPDTPVVLARNLGRTEETITLVTLGELSPDYADMLTLVLVGAASTRLLRRGVNAWVYTPRGYTARVPRPQEGA